MNTERLTRSSLLTAIALIIFIVEVRLPNLIPIQGVKPGLANIVTVYSVYTSNTAETVMIVFARILLGAIFCGNLSSLLYSAAGAVFCLCGMILIRKFIPPNYIWLCSIFGAIFHNMGQIAAAVAIMRTSSVFAYLPILVLTGCISGLFTGICAQTVLRKQKKIPKK